MFELLKPLADPYVALLLLAGILLLCARISIRSRIEGGSKLVSCALLVWLLLFVVSTPVAGHFLSRSLESAFPAAQTLPEDVKTVVVLGGGRIPASPDDEPALPSISSQQRCIKAVAVLEELPETRVLLCGGVVDPREPGEGEAELMADYLRARGIDPDRIDLETESRSTFENVEHASLRLREQEVKIIILVTHARHLKRATACFETFGIEVFPVGCARSHVDLQSMRQYLPSVAGLSTSRDALHEWLGILYYTASGKM